MNRKLSILLILLLCSCASIGKRDILFGKCNKGYLACTQFELKKDGTFEYYIFMDVGGGNLIKGKWESISQDSMILNTLEQPIIKKTYYEGSMNSELKEKIRIQISDHEMPLGYASFEINNGEITGSVNENGIGYFEVDKIKNITYYYLGDRKETIQIKELLYNDIQIYVRDIESSAIPEYFVDEVVVVNEKEIIMNPNSIEKRFKLKRARTGEKYWK